MDTLPLSSATIDYYTKSVFGRNVCYLSDDRQAMQWNSLTGRKTITNSEMAVLTNLTGATFNRVFEPEK